MNSNVIIIGNSGAARECFYLLREVMASQTNLRFKGFLSFEGYPENLRDLREMSLGSDDDYLPETNDEFIIGVGSPELRRRIFDKWKRRGGRFMTLKHPGANVLDGVRMGEGNIIAGGCHFSCGVVIGDANFFNGSVVLGHDAQVGGANFFAPFSMLLGESRVGSGNRLGARATLLPHAKIGDANTIAPGAFIYKGCGNGRRMAGNPALDIG